MLGLHRLASCCWRASACSASRASLVYGARRRRGVAAVLLVIVGALISIARRRASPSSASSASSSSARLSLVARRRSSASGWSRQAGLRSRSALASRSSSAPRCAARHSGRRPAARRCSRRWASSLLVSWLLFAGGNVPVPNSSTATSRCSSSAASRWSLASHLRARLQRRPHARRSLTRFGGALLQPCAVDPDRRRVPAREQVPHRHDDRDDLARDVRAGHDVDDELELRPHLPQRRRARRLRRRRHREPRQPDRRPQQALTRRRRAASTAAAIAGVDEVRRRQQPRRRSPQRARQRR